MNFLCFRYNFISITIFCSTFIFFIFSSLRHILFQSTAWDLAIFDQAVYLISQGKIPNSSFLNIHILGDHASLILYPLSLFYVFYPSVYWLFFVQALSLSLGILPIYYLCQNQGLNKNDSLMIIFIYLFYPLVFNINLFDFHPDVIFIPAILFALLAVFENRFFLFVLSILIALSCKSIFSLTVMFMGLWLLSFEKKKFSLFAIGSGLTWFIVSTKVIIPIFGNNNSNIERHIERFNYLGNTFSEITHNLFFRPTLVLEGIFNLSNFGYLLLLMAPIFWGISLVSLSPLISCIPSFAINLLSQNILQKDLLHHYSLPILPFLMVVVIKTIAQRKKPIWRKYIFLWSLISFIALAKLGNFTSRYLVSLDMWTANTEAINKIYNKESVLTYSYIAPHISHRSIVKLIEQEANINLEQFNNILLNDVFPQSENIKRRIQESDHFSLTFQKNNVYLFQKNNV